VNCTQIAPAQEAQLIVRSLRVTTLPKLALADTRRFVDLVADVFPDVSVSDVSDAELEAAIGAVCREMKLESVSTQVEKVLQLHMACKQRIGVIVVGPSGTGKVDTLTLGLARLTIELTVCLIECSLWKPWLLLW
jgi:dynein heavy chain 2